MSKRLSDVAFALDYPLNDDERPQWSLRRALTGLWPPLKSSPDISVHELMGRFATAGVALRTLADGGADLWKDIKRSDMVQLIRDRLRDPAIMQQHPTDLCGPISILVEYARRRPTTYVRAADQLLSQGRLSLASGEAVVAMRGLRGQPVPRAKNDLTEAEWIFAATMRDMESGTSGEFDPHGLSAMTFWWQMAYWVRQLLRLDSHWETCFSSGELDALLRAQDAIDRGGVAFLLVDSSLIKWGRDVDAEEDMWWQSAKHRPRTAYGEPSGWVKHSQDDDAVLPDHWVLYLGGLNPRYPGEDDTITLRLWSWGTVFRMSGSAASFGEYLYAVVTGTPG